MLTTVLRCTCEVHVQHSDMGVGFYGLLVFNTGCEQASSKEIEQNFLGGNPCLTCRCFLTISFVL